MAETGRAGALRTCQFMRQDHRDPALRGYKNG